MLAFSITNRGVWVAVVLVVLVILTIAKFIWLEIKEEAKHRRTDIFD